MISIFDRIFADKLRLFKGPEGSSPSQFNTHEVGIIDILAQDTADGSCVVIELKKRKSSDVVVGQVLRYMGGFRNNSVKKTKRSEDLSSARSATRGWITP